MARSPSMKEKKTVLLVLCWSLFLAASSSAKAQKYNAVYNFGDSITDTGNLCTNGRPTAITFTQPPYGETYFGTPTCRCCDGRVIVDFLSNQFKLPFLPPSKSTTADFKKGANMAITGATAMDAPFFRSLGLSDRIWNNGPISFQIQWFQQITSAVCGTSCKSYLAKSLFVFGEFGGNDYNAMLFGNYNTDQASTYTPQIISTIGDGVEKLIALGAVDIVVPGVLPIGCFPIYLTIYGTSSAADYDSLGCLKKFNDLSTNHNNQLQTKIAALQAKYASGRLLPNGRQDRCISLYVDARGGVVGASLRDLGLDYLRNPADDAQALGPGVELWGRHLEFVVRRLLESERQLCIKVFGQHKSDASACFAEVAARASVLDFLSFGRAAADAKKDPIKLMRLLEVFDSLNKLRLDFNRLFGGKACADIQCQTRDLVKLLVDGAVEIFEELLVQVELQRQMPPPADGGVPRLVTFVVEYCNRLLGEKYRPVLAQVLTIHRSWRKEVFNDKMLAAAVLNIVKALEANFDVWSRSYGNKTLSYIFMMNTRWHLFKHVKTTKLGELLGDVWIRDHEQFKDYYTTMFMRSSWGALSPLLNREGLILFSKGRATAKDLVKQRLKTFNARFGEMFHEQSAWIIPDKDLRRETCDHVMQAIVPAYRSYMQNYGPLVEQDVSASKYVKYTVDGLEKMLGGLFVTRPKRSGSFQIGHSNGKMSSAMAGLYRSASTVK